MTSVTFVLLSGTLTFGVPLALAVRELLVLRPAGGSPWRDPAPEEEPPLAPSDATGPGRRLPDCLIPKPMVDAPELVD